MKTKKHTGEKDTGAIKNGVLVKQAPVTAKHVTRKGKRMVMLEEAEFDRLMSEADLFEPFVPGPDANGNYSIETIRADLALRLVRHRRKAGLTQAELARRVGIKKEKLNRIEHAEIHPGERLVAKIDKILCAIVEEDRPDW
jgi:DNA-binding XRE family transcriptional regulator